MKSSRLPASARLAGLPAAQIERVVLSSSASDLFHRAEVARRARRRARRLLPRAGRLARALELPRLLVAPLYLAALDADVVVDVLDAQDRFGELLDEVLRSAILDAALEGHLGVADRHGDPGRIELPLHQPVAQVLADALVGARVAL